MNCKVCGESFSSPRGLHIHLKVHGGQKKYYHSYFPRYDWFDGSLIPFKNYNQYFSTCFSSQKNRRHYYNNKNERDVREAILTEWELHPKTRALTVFPSETYFMLTDLCRIHDIKKGFGSVAEFCKEVGLKQLFTDKPPLDWLNYNSKDMEVLIDTREQKPFYFRNAVSQKLSIGDYIATGKYFSKVSVDRKSVADFKSSFGADIKRIRKNVEFANDMGYRLVFVVESNPHKIERERKKYAWERTNYGFIYNNVKQLLLDYPTTQVVFCDNISQAKSITDRVLYFGDKLKNVDLQYFVNLDYVDKRKTRLQR